MNERFAVSFPAALSYYAALSPVSGFQGRCAMSIPADIEGKRVLDVCCRKGKGAFALADAVGTSGFVVGVDPDAGNVAAACAAAPKNHWAGASWDRHLRFFPAIPENLSQACIEDGSFDLVYINSVVNLAWSLPVALAEFARVLTPGGRLWIAQGVFAEDGFGAQGDIVGESGPIDVFSQARSCAALERMCLEAGFSSVSFSSISPLVGESLSDGGCSDGESFYLADACATI